MRWCWYFPVVAWPERTSCIISNFDTRRGKKRRNRRFFCVSGEQKEKRLWWCMCVCCAVWVRESAQFQFSFWFPVTPFIGLFSLAFRGDLYNCLYTISLERVSICAAVVSFFGFLFFLSGTLSSDRRERSIFSRHKTISWKKKLNANYAFPLNATADKEIHTNIVHGDTKLFFQLLFSQSSESGGGTKREVRGKLLCRGPLSALAFSK